MLTLINLLVVVWVICTLFILDRLQKKGILKMQRGHFYTMLVLAPVTFFILLLTR